MRDPLVLAAGGVVVRHGASGSEVVVVHRPKYDDWSLPKGKLDPGESLAAAAVREVREETSLECRLVRDLGEVRYRDAKGRSKLVRFWLMQPVDGDVAERSPDAEVDQVRWVGIEVARELLTYDRERSLVDLALDRNGA